jgi:hypothetical protein
VCAARWVCRNGLPRQIAARQELAVAVRQRLTPRMRPPVVQQGMGRVGICPRRICRLSRSPPRPWASFYTILVCGPLAACLSRRIRRLSLPPVPGIAAVSCRCNAPPYRAAVSLLYHAAAMRRRIEQRYRCRIMPPQRRDAPPYQAAVSYRRNIAAISSLRIAAVSCSRIAPPNRASVSLPYHAAATP